MMFLAAVVTDSIPVIGPPVWTVMVFMLIKFDLNPWLVLAVGVPGSVVGRYILGLYVEKFSGKFLRPARTEDMKFAGRKLNGSLWRCWSFVLVYSLLPLSTTALFSAAGMAKIRPRLLLPPFFVGKFASDAVMLFSGRYALHSVADVVHGVFSPKGITTMLLGLVILAAFVFLDWRLLLEKKKVRLTFSVWK